MVQIHDKLVRDLIPAKIRAKGQKPEVQVLDDPAAFRRALLKKFAEEGEEVSKARTREELIAELGDVMQLVHEICREWGISLQQIEDARTRKLVTHGGFDQRLFLGMVLFPPKAPDAEGQ